MSGHLISSSVAVIMKIINDKASFLSVLVSSDFSEQL